MINENFPAGYDPWSMIQQAMQMQQPGIPVQMPQMTPASYGPMHSTLADAFAQSLQRQASYPGLLSQPTAADMGLLSTAMVPATPINMAPSGASPVLGPNEYYRLSQAYWNAMPNVLRGGATAGTGTTAPATRGFGGGVFGRNDLPMSGGTSTGGGGFTPNPTRANYSTGESQVYGGGSDMMGIF